MWYDAAKGVRELGYSPAPRAPGAQGRRGPWFLANGYVPPYDRPGMRRPSRPRPWGATVAPVGGAAAGQDPSALASAPAGPIIPEGAPSQDGRAPSSGRHGPVPAGAPSRAPAWPARTTLYARASSCLRPVRRLQPGIRPPGDLVVTLSPDFGTWLGISAPAGAGSAAPPSGKVVADAGPGLVAPEDKARAGPDQRRARRRHGDRRRPRLGRRRAARLRSRAGRPRPRRRAACPTVPRATSSLALAYDTPPIGRPRGSRLRYLRLRGCASARPWRASAIPGRLLRDL